MSALETSWFPFAVSLACKSTVIWAAAWLVSTLMRRHSAAARHLVWMAAAAMVLLLPLLTLCLPALPVSGAATMLDSGSLLLRVDAAPTVSVDASRTAANAVSRSAPSNSAPAPFDWRFWAVWLWMGGIAVSAAQVAAGCLAMLRARRQSIPFADPATAAALAQSLGIARPVTVFESARIAMPMTFGFFRPAVYLPAGAAAWPADRLSLVLLHELAHVRRADSATHWLARAALALHWWNPLSWHAFRAFLKERERAADDMVLAGGVRSSDYAAQLLDVARSLRTDSVMGWAAIAMARPSQLEGRLLAILDPATRRRAPRRLASLAASALAIALTVPLAAVHAQTAGPALPPDIDATIRAANAQKNHEILDNAARAAEAQGKLEIARKLLDASATLREQVSGSKSVAYGLGLIRLGELANRQGRVDEAATDYTRAVDAIGERPEAGPAMIELGILSWSAKDPEKAFGYFQQALRSDSDHAATALMWMAAVRSRQSDTVSEAEAYFRQALAQPDADATSRRVIRTLFADFLKNNGRTGEAAPVDAAAREADPAEIAGLRPPLHEGVYRVGNGVTSPIPVSRTEAQYSVEARLLKYSGEVTLSIEIGTDGVVRNIRIAHGLGLGLDEKAVDAVSQWHFKPGTKDGVPVAVQAMIAVNFRLL